MNDDERVQRMLHIAEKLESMGIHPDPSLVAALARTNPNPRMGPPPQRRTIRYGKKEQQS